MLYRSGTMALLTDGDADHLRSLGIRAICDFRRGNERTAEPTLWHGADVDYFCRDYTESSGLLGEMLQREGATADDMRRTMIAQIGRAQSELQSLMRISYAVFCLKKKK